jgi:hypothetical protein
LQASGDVQISTRECGAPQNEVPAQRENSSKVCRLAILSDDTALTTHGGRETVGAVPALFQLTPGCCRMYSSDCWDTATTFPRSSRLNVFTYFREPPESRYEREKLTL